MFNRRNHLDMFSKREIGSEEWYENIRMNPIIDKFKIFSRIQKDGLQTAPNTPRSEEQKDKTYTKR